MTGKVIVEPLSRHCPVCASARIAWQAYNDDGTETAFDEEPSYAIFTCLACGHEWRQEAEL